MTQEMKQCLEDCLDCYRICTRTRSHCLKMGGKHLEETHLRLLEDCARLCGVSADFMLCGSERSSDLCQACESVCRACAESCEQVDANDDLMMQCADMCRKCAVSCDKMIAGV